MYYICDLRHIRREFLIFSDVGYCSPCLSSSFFRILESLTTLTYYYVWAPLLLLFFFLRGCSLSIVGKRQKTKQNKKKYRRGWGLLWRRYEKRQRTMIRKYVVVDSQQSHTLNSPLLDAWPAMLMMMMMIRIFAIVRYGTSVERRQPHTIRSSSCNQKAASIISKGSSSRPHCLCYGPLDIY